MDLLEETNTVYRKGLVVIQESKYTKVNHDCIAAQQKLMSPQQQADLAALMHKFPELFNGQVGHYPHQTVHLELCLMQHLLADALLLWCMLIELSFSQSYKDSVL